MDDERKPNIDELLDGARVELEQEFADHDPAAFTRRLIDRIEREYALDSNALDRHITGNWGEDSVPEEFIKAERLAYQPLGTRIDVSKETHPVEIVATIERVSITSGFVYVTAEEFANTLVFPQDAMVRLADD